MQMKKMIKALNLYAFCYFSVFFLTFSHCSDHNTQMGILDKPRQGGIEAEMESASSMTGEDN